MTRIRYTRNGKVLSSNPILVGKDFYRVIIHVETNWLLIVGSNNSVTQSHECKTLRDTKLFAKRLLRQMGATFYDEVRRR